MMKIGMLLVRACAGLIIILWIHALVHHGINSPGSQFLLWCIAVLMVLSFSPRRDT